MERARWKNNKMSIEADELPYLYEKDSNLNKSDFICIGCDGESTACSYKPENKKRPYFRVDEHTTDCDVFKYKELTKTGKKKRVSNADGFPLPYPSKLYLQDKDIRKANEDDLNSTNSNSIKTINSYVGSSDESVNPTSHNRTSSTIRPIVEHFIHFPYDRDSKLELPMLENKNTYDAIFRKINQFKLDITKTENIKNQWTNKYSVTQLYYGTLSLEKDSIIKEKNNINLKLFLQDYTPIHLDINTSKWSIRKYNEVIKELEDAKLNKTNEFSNNLKNCIKEYKEENNINIKEELDKRIIDKLYKNVKVEMNKENNNIYIFFVGQLDEDNNKNFKLYNNDFRLYYSGFFKITYPKYGK